MLHKRDFKVSIYLRPIIPLDPLGGCHGGTLVLAEDYTAFDTRGK